MNMEPTREDILEDMAEALFEEYRFEYYLWILSMLVYRLNGMADDSLSSVRHCADGADMLVTKTECHYWTATGTRSQWYHEYTYLHTPPVYPPITPFGFAKKYKIYMSCAAGKRLHVKPITAAQFPLLVRIVQKLSVEAMKDKVLLPLRIFSSHNYLTLMGSPYLQAKTDLFMTDTFTGNPNQRDNQAHNIWIGPAVGGLLGYSVTGYSLQSKIKTRLDRGSIKSKYDMFPDLNIFEERGKQYNLQPPDGSAGHERYDLMKGFFG